MRGRALENVAIRTPRCPACVWLSCQSSVMRLRRARDVEMSRSHRHRHRHRCVHARCRTTYSCTRSNVRADVRRVDNDMYRAAIRSAVSTVSVFVCRCVCLLFHVNNIHDTAYQHTCEKTWGSEVHLFMFRLHSLVLSSVPYVHSVHACPLCGHVS